MKNNGFQNEKDFIQYLNNKTYGQLHPIMQDLLSALYDNKIYDDDVITASKYYPYEKVDITVEINGLEKGISIKKGSRNSVHQERIEKFLHSIENYQNLPKINEIKTEILKYQYADGTDNNTGFNRMSALEYQKLYPQKIKKVNEFLNNKDIKEELIYKFLINSRLGYELKVDAFILGTPYDFIWATTKEVVKYLKANKKRYKSMHVSNLYLNSWNRNLQYKERYTEHRYYLQVKWYSMYTDIIKIMCIRKNK